MCAEEQERLDDLLDLRAAMGKGVTMPYEVFCSELDDAIEEDKQLSQEEADEIHAMPIHRTPTARRRSGLTKETQV